MEDCVGFFFVALSVCGALFVSGVLVKTLPTKRTHKLPTKPPSARALSWPERRVNAVRCAVKVYADAVAAGDNKETRFALDHIERLVKMERERVAEAELQDRITSTFKDLSNAALGHVNVKPPEQA